MSRDVLPRAVRAVRDARTAAGVLLDLAPLVVEGLADWCLADLLEPPDLVTRVVALGRDGPLPLPASAGAVDARRSSAQAVGLLARLLDAPGRVLRLGADDLRALEQADDPRLRDQARLGLAMGTTDLLVLGVSGRNALLGVLTLGRAGGRFADAEVAALTDLVGVAALALDAVRLHELQRGVSTALQRSLLPQLPVVPGVVLAARFVPAGGGLAVGGDWYDAFLLPDGELALAVGDATGHDVQAAARMAELRNLLRAVAADQQDAPAGTLTRLDAVAAHLSPELSGTCVYARVALDGDGAQLVWSSAGHLPPVLLRDGRAEVLATQPDLMLGVREGTLRHDHRRALLAGDVLVLFTDGLVEDRRTSLDVRLEVLARLVEQTGPVSVERLVDVLVAELASGEDDVAVLVVRLGA